MLVHQHAAQFGEIVGWVFELVEDDRPLMNRQREQADSVNDCAFEPIGPDLDPAAWVVDSDRERRSGRRVKFHASPGNLVPARVMLAGVRVADTATAELASMVRAAGADVLAGRLDQALADGVSLIALTIDERAPRARGSRSRC